MNQNEINEFTEVLAGTITATGGAKPLPEAIAAWWCDLERFQLDHVKAALAHYRLNPIDRKPPQPADIVRMLTGGDGRPTAEEAWALVKPIIGNESRSACLTTDMCEAWNLAEGAWQEGSRRGGDFVAARMAFKDSYNRSVAAARYSGEKVKWWVTAGTDPHENARVRLQAIQDGKIQNKITTSRIAIEVDGQVQIIEQMHCAANALPFSSNTLDQTDEIRERVMIDAQNVKNGLPRLTDAQHEQRFATKKYVVAAQFAALKARISPVVSKLDITSIDDLPRTNETASMDFTSHLNPVFKGKKYA